MNIPTRVLAFAALAVTLGMSAPAQAQERLKVLSDEPVEAALRAIGAAFRNRSGQQLEYVIAPSPVLYKKLLNGEIADVVIMQPNFVAELAKAGRIVPASHPIVGRAGFGLAARADAPARDIRSLETLTQALLSADALVFNDRASGDHFAGALRRLNIAEAVSGKVVRLPPAAVFARIGQANGNEIGVGTIPQILANRSLRLLGPLPPEFQSHIVYAAAPVKSDASSTVANSFVEFLTGQRAKALFADHGIE